MRLFIALPLPPDVRRALVYAQEQLKAVADGGRYVPADNFHLTLHFIGESNDLSGAAASCDEAVRGIRPMLLRLTGFGRFQKSGAYTGYVTLGGDLIELYKLHESLVAALMERGFSLTGGHRRLTPHITLARNLLPKEPDGFNALTLPARVGNAYTANQLVLYQSESIGGRMVYTQLHRAKI